VLQPNLFQKAKFSLFRTAQSSSVAPCCKYLQDSYLREYIESIHPKPTMDSQERVRP